MKALVLLLLLISAATGPACGATPPAWVRQFPHDPDRYLGIGHGDKRAHPRDYRERAQAAALAQISREIRVRIRAESRSAQVEDGSGWGDAFTQTVRAESRADLEGCERAAVHETESDYWVLYALDKTAWRASREAEARALESWLAREGAALERDLEARRLQAAADRWTEIRVQYRERYLDRAPPPPSEGLPGRYAALEARLGEAIRGAVLSVEPADWSFDFTAPKPNAVPGAGLSLADAATGIPWRGPFRVRLAPRGSRPGGEAAACLVSTDAEGRLDPVMSLEACGLGSGAWTLAWGPLESPARADVSVEVIRAEAGLSLHAPAPGADPDFLARLRAGLAGLGHPRWRVVPGLAAACSLEVRLREIAVDSLDGMRFATVRGRIRFPGGSVAEAAGKAGHADRGRALERALRDFARDVERLWAGGGRVTPESPRAGTGW